MKKLLLLLVALAGCVGVAGAQVGVNGTKATNMTGQRSAGITSDSLTTLVKVTAGGSMNVNLTNRQADENTIVQLLTDYSVPPRTSILSGFKSISPYAQYQVHVSWTDSLKTSASIDSVAFEIGFVGKQSATSDGFDYYIDMSLGLVAAGADTLIDGVLIGSPRYPRITTVGSPNSIFIPNHFYRLDLATGVGGGTQTYGTYQVSFPLATKQGAWIAEDIIGVWVRNCSAGASGGATGVNILHNLNISLVAKAN